MYLFNVLLGVALVVMGATVLAIWIYLIYILIIKGVKYVTKWK